MLKLEDLVQLQKLQSKPALVQLVETGTSKLLLLIVSIQLGMYALNLRFFEC